jgi:hypothetical protein
MTKREDLRTLLFSGGELPREKVTIMVKDAPVEVEVVGLSSDARGQLLSTCMRQVENEDGEKDTEVDLQKLGPELIIHCAVVPGSEEKLFGEADRDMLGSKAATYLDPIVKMATKLSGLGESAAKAARKNSSATPS